MLTHLAITNIALISRLAVDFSSGFTALTGETGAGKSLLMDALGLALGSRADAGLIRHGEAQAEVSATFQPVLTPALQTLLEEQGVELDGNQLILRRQLKREGGQGNSGSSKAWVNGTPVAAGVLVQFASLVVDVQAQHGQQALLAPAMQRDVLDTLAGLTPQREKTAQTYTAWQSAKSAAQALAAQCEQARADAERLTEWRKDLEQLAYQPGEEDTLAGQRSRLVNFTQLHGNLTSADDALASDKGTLASLRVASRATAAAAQFDSSLQSLAARLESALTEVADIAHDIARAASSLEAEGNLETIDDRLHALKAAARRHQVEISQLPAVLTQLTAQTSNLSQTEAELAELERAATAAQQTFIAAAQALTAARQAAATTLAPRLENALRGLHLPHATLTVALTPLPQTQWNATGAEGVELLLSANPGSPAQPITKVASGGELSRLLLALKSVLYQGLPAQTVVFDEIDTGLSGASAAAVGRSMAALGRQHQVLAITHHPQVAAHAAHHLSIAKQAEGGHTTTTLKTLTGPTRIEELARLLSGSNVTPQARAAAQALLAESQPGQQKAA